MWKGRVKRGKDGGWENIIKETEIFFVEIFFKETRIYFSEN